jgi:hypothetical protein
MNYANLEINTMKGFQRTMALTDLMVEVRNAMAAVFVAKAPQIDAAGLSFVAFNLRHELELRLAYVADEQSSA